MDREEDTAIDGKQKHMDIITYTHTALINEENDLLFDCQFTDSLQSIFVNFDSFGIIESEDDEVKDELICRMKLMFRIGKDNKLVEVTSGRTTECRLPKKVKIEVEVKGLSIYLRIKNIKSNVNFTSCCSLIITTEC